MSGVVAVAVLWGMAYVLTEAALSAAAPVIVAWARIVLAALVLVPVLLWRGHPLLPPRGSRRHLLVVAVTVAVVPFGLTAWAQQRVESALAAVLMAAIPLFTAPCAAMLTTERLPARRWFGLVLGLVGVTILAGLGSGQGTAHTVGGVIALIVAVASYGLGYAYIARFLPALAPIQIAAGSQLIAATMLAVPALATLAVSGVHPRVSSVAAVVALGVGSTGAAQLLNYRNIARLGPTGASLATYLVPVVGVAAAVVVSGDPIRAGLPIGASIILASVALARPRRIAGLGSAAPRRRPEPAEYAAAHVDSPRPR